MPEVTVSFRARLDPEAFQRAKPFIAAANGKTAADYQHDHEYVADFLLSMDAYAQAVGSELVAPLDAGIEFVNWDGAGDAHVTAQPAPIEVEIEIPQVWADLVGTTVPKGSPTGVAAVHDPRPHFEDYRRVEAKRNGITVQATLAVDEFDDTYSLTYDAKGPGGDGPRDTHGYDLIGPAELVLADTGLRVQVTPKVVPAKRGGGYSFPELIAIANRHYDNGFGNLEEPENLKADGDVDYPNLQPGLERYLVVELFETFDASLGKREQLEEARRALSNSVTDIERALQGIEEELETLD